MEKHIIKIKFIPTAMYLLVDICKVSELNFKYKNLLMNCLLKFFGAI